MKRLRVSVSSAFYRLPHGRHTDERVQALARAARALRRLTSTQHVCNGVDAADGARSLVRVSADLFCALPALGEGYDCNPSGLTMGVFTLTTDADADAMSGPFAFFVFTPNSTESVARSAVFPVSAAEDVTVYVRARTHSNGAFGIFRASLTLSFLPD